MKSCNWASGPNTGLKWSTTSFSLSHWRKRRPATYITPLHPSTSTQPYHSWVQRGALGKSASMLLQHFVLNTRWKVVIRDGGGRFCKCALPYSHKTENQQASTPEIQLICGNVKEVVIVVAAGPVPRRHFLIWFTDKQAFSLFSRIEWNDTSNQRHHAASCGCLSPTEVSSWGSFCS